jgi:S-(hydroxymethyl)glutathione dehydrogenase/alcohol dehydrogenase
MLVRGCSLFLDAAVLEKTGQPLRLMRLEAPSLGEGQILVKVLYSGVCRSQLMEVRGKRGEDDWLPHLLGHEGSGIVVEIGPGVTKVSPGDSVILSWIKGDGLDAPGAIYHEGGRNINSGPVTTFSNFTVVAENRVVVKPDSLDFDTAVLFGCALPTGAGMVLNELSITPKQTVAVLGLGGIGISAVMALLATGVKEIIAVDVSAEKLERVKMWGVSHYLNSNDGDVASRVKALTNGGVDFCIEATGSITGIEQGFSVIRKFGGQLLFASHPPDGEMIKLSPHDLISGKKISGSWGGSVKLDRDIPRFHTLFSNAKMPLNSLLTKRYGLQQINTALDDLEVGRVFRPLIVMQHQKLLLNRK